MVTASWRGCCGGMGCHSYQDHGYEKDHGYDKDHDNHYDHDYYFHNDHYHSSLLLSLSLPVYRTSRGGNFKNK